MRDFETWLKTMTGNISTWEYYTDFKKVYKNIDAIKVELNILNSLVGSEKIKEEFIGLYKKYPEILKVIPILLAKRESEIKIKDTKKDYAFRFDKPNYSVEDYALFMEKTGLFDLISNHVINNLVDYVMGIEVGMDTNARKNRTGDSMENIVESYLINYGFIKNKTYFKEMYKSEVEKKFGVNLSSISNKGKTEKRFDFVFVKNGRVYGVECNFYSGGGSKLNETARSYKNLAIESEDIGNFTFVWFTDGTGWNSAKHNLEETFDSLPTVFNLNDLRNGILDCIEDYVNELSAKK